MTAAPADVDLCLRLYEQRRDRELRRAREWMMAFAPTSFAEIKAVIDGREGRKANRFWRMATSYWEMIAALMMSGGVSPAGRALFAETTREFFFVFAKVRPYLGDLRAALSPMFFRRLEEYCLSLPEHDALQAYFEKRRAAAAAAAPAAKSGRATKRK
jgi:hypothetical protein